MRTIAPVELFSSLWAGGSLARIYRGYGHKSHKITSNKNENESQSTLLLSMLLLLRLSCLPDSTRAAAFEVCWEKSWGS